MPAATCRITDSPRGYGLEVGGEPQGPRAQVAIYAVAQGGTALSSASGQGRFTGYLLDGLQGKGSAADYIPGRGHYVTAPSLHEYASRRVAEALEGYDDWTRAIQSPQILQVGPAVDPLRRIPTPPPCHFVVSVRPPEAEAAVEIALEVQPGLPVPGWPPTAPSRVYELRAKLRPGMDQEWNNPTPDLAPVDLREQKTAVVRVSRCTPASENRQALLPTTTGERGVARARTVKQEPGPVIDGILPIKPFAILTVVAVDRVARIRLRQAETPWQQLDRGANTMIYLRPGVWDVMVTLGDETTSATRVVLHDGEHRTVTAVAQITPATAALLPRWAPGQRIPTAPATVTPSESIGPIQGAILRTLLPLLALKLYDTDHVILRHFDQLQIPPFGRQEIKSEEAPFAVAIAADGSQPEKSQAHVSDANLVWTGADSRVALFGGWRRHSRDAITINLGNQSLNVAAPRLPGGVTVIGVVTWPNGYVDLSLGVYRLPLGDSWDAEAARIPVELIARALALAAPLFRAGANLQGVPDDLLKDASNARWTDPILSAMAFHALDRALTIGSPLSDQVSVAHLGQMREEIRARLKNSFVTLADSRIIAALEADHESRRVALVALLEDPDLAQPVLTASLAHLAQAAMEGDRKTHWSVERYDRIVPGRVFNVVRTL